MILEEWKQIPLFMCVRHLERNDNLANIEEKVQKLITPYIEKLGYELYDVEYLKERKRLFPKNIYR